DTRADRTWQLEVETTRRVRGRVVGFVLGSVTHQSSNVAALAFDQARVTAGLRFLLVADRARRLSTYGWASSAAGAPGWGVPTAAPPPGDTSRSGHSPPLRVESGPGSTPSSEVIVEVPGGVSLRVHAPTAGTVFVVGGFNGWDPTRTPLRGPAPDGTWDCVIALPPGAWRYALVVDSVWVKPPGASRYEEDGFGGVNGILDVAGEVGGGEGAEGAGGGSPPESTDPAAPPPRE
ncbi:MAG: hypothetical protein ABH877_02330, partial [bacterium]